MRCSNGGCSTCKTAGIFASVLLSIAVGALSFLGYFTFAELALYTAFALGALAVIGVIAGMAVRRREGAFSCCLCKNAAQILTGGVGSFLFSLAALVIGTAVGSTATAVLLAAAAFFFFLIIAGVVCFAECLINTCD
ncbi:MAG: hypothetical protein J5590_06395 [Clostridia bacterium]|nr:hypothetical protein [Clostridia bacterium]